MQTQTVTAETIQRLARKGIAHRPELATRIEKATMIVLFRTVEQTDADSHEYRVESENEPGRFYRVNGTCECPDFGRRAPGGWCKHRISVALIERGTEDEQLARDDRAAVIAEWTYAASVRGY